MSNKQTKHICGNPKVLASKISTEMMQPSATSSTSLLVPSSSPMACKPIHAPNHNSGLKSIIRMVAHFPTTWASRLITTRSRQSDITTITTTASKSTSEASSQDEMGVSDQRGIDTPPAGQLRGSPSKNISYGMAREYHDVLDLCSPGDIGVGDRDRDRHWGAVADADMMYMRAFVDGLHIIYL